MFDLSLVEDTLASLIFHCCTGATIEDAIPGIATIVMVVVFPVKMAGRVL